MGVIKYWGTQGLWGRKENCGKEWRIVGDQTIMKMNYGGEQRTLGERIVGKMECGREQHYRRKWRFVRDNEEENGDV